MINPVATRQVRLTGRAARLLQLLTDFGHLDAPSVDSVLVALSSQYGATNGVVTVDIAQVRPVVAAFLVEARDTSSGPLAEDWGPLFH